MNYELIFKLTILVFMVMSVALTFLFIRYGKRPFGDMDAPVKQLFIVVLGVVGIVVYVILMIFFLKVTEEGFFVGLYLILIGIPFGMILEDAYAYWLL